MTGTTPNYGIHYPTSGDALDDTLLVTMPQMATDVDSAIATANFGAPGAWQTPTFLNNFGPWTDTANELPRYRKQGQLVTVQGLFRRVSGSGSIAFQLPVGYRPPRTVWRFCEVNSVVGISIIDNLGNLSVSTPAVVNGQHISVFTQFYLDSP